VSWIEYLEASGPFTTPLCVAMGFALRWLLKDRGELLVDLKAAHADATSLREKRAEDLENAAREYMQHGEALRNVVREWTLTAREVLRIAGTAR